jgi:hypothetical protein
VFFNTSLIGLEYRVLKMTKSSLSFGMRFVWQHDD